MFTRNDLKHFVRNEGGAGTTLSLFLFVCLVCLLGIMVDATNGWRNRTYMTASADMGAHAGAVGIANGLTDQQIKDEVERIVEANLPVPLFGNTIDTATDVTFAYRDPETGAYDATATTYNTVIVDIQQTAARGNPVSALMTQFIGTSFYQVRAGSAATYDKAGLCTASEGVFAEGEVTMTTQHTVGGQICIHSNEAVWLPQQNTFSKDANNLSVVSMPDLADCKSKCNESANPGLIEGYNAVELNMVFPAFDTFIQNTYTCFESGGYSGCAIVDPNTLPQKTYDKFFSTRPLGMVEGKTAADYLAEKTGRLTDADGRLYSLLDKGDLVSLSRDDFLAIPELPGGLVYEVTCSGNGTKARLPFSGTVGVMKDSALLTNCAVDFEDGTEIVSSLVVTDRIASNATVSATNNVTIGDGRTPGSAVCKPEERSYIMAMSKAGFPAATGMSNVTFVVDDDVDVASGTSLVTPLDGFAIYASGRVHMAAQRTMSACAADDYLSPFGQVIRIVMPPKPPAT